MDRLPFLVLLVLLLTSATPATGAPSQPCTLSTGQDLVAGTVTSGGTRCEAWDATSAPARGASLPVAIAGVVAYSADTVGIYAFDATTGEPAWSRAFTEHGLFDMVGDAQRGRILSTGYMRGPGGGAAVWAWDAATGAPIWRSTTSGSSTWGNAIALSPGGSLVGIAGEGGGLGGGLVRVVDAQTGASVWEARLTLGPSGNFGWAGFSGDGSTLFVGGSFGPDYDEYVVGLAAYDAATGALRWSGLYATPGESQKWLGDVVVVGNDLLVVSDLFVGGASHLSYVRGGDGAVTWRFDRDTDAFSGAWKMDIAVDGDTVFLYLSGQRVSLRALDLATGETRAVGVAPYFMEEMIFEPSTRTLLFAGGPCCGTRGFATVALDADTFVQQWYARYIHPDLPHNRARDIILSEDGARVFTVGFAGVGDFVVQAVEAAVAAYPVVRAPLT